MLKAEAVDLQPFASYFNFPDIDKCQKLFRNSRDQMISNAQIEVNTEFHRAIDKIVFDFMELDFQDREYIVNMLTKKVDSRYKKTTAK